MTKKLPISMGMALAVGLSASSQAQILFDIDGPGGTFSPHALTGFDWAPGNFLADDALPLAVGQEFTGLYQAELGQVSFADVPPEGIPIGDQGPFEITAELTMNLVVESLVDGIANFSTLEGGTFRIFFDEVNAGDLDNADGFTNNVGDANNAYGTGILILEGVVMERDLSSDFTIQDDTPVPLDQFPGPPTSPGLTVDGLGAANVDILVNFTNPEWFLGEIITTSLLVSNLDTPFNTVNPELNVLGVAPDRGPDDIRPYWKLNYVEI